LARVRRSPHVYFYAPHRAILDADALLAGAVRVERRDDLVALSVLAGREYVLAPSYLERLLALPSTSWVVAEDDDEVLRSLAAMALVVSDDPDPLLVEFRRRDELLTSGQWHPHAALHHFMTKWHNVGTGVEADAWQELVAELPERYAALERHGPAPPPFHSEVGLRRDLPLVRQPGRLYELLEQRRTVREFAVDEPATERELAIVLYEVFGAHAYVRVAENVVLLGKTSPSGGARHALEIYPLLLNVEGFDPGIYHYDVQQHGCVLLQALKRDEARDLASEFASGQSWVRDAAAVFVVAARFYRSFWKYRRHSRIFMSLFADAGHLSQTMYLVCTDLGLGPFFTAAINGRNIEDTLGFDGVRMGALAVCGFGRPRSADAPANPAFLPYVPRETTI